MGSNEATQPKREKEGENKAGKKEFQQQHLNPRCWASWYICWTDDGETKALAKVLWVNTWYLKKSENNLHKCKSGSKLSIYFIINGLILLKLHIVNKF